MLLAERLVGEARERRGRRMSRRERNVLSVAAGSFLAVALVIAAVLPVERETDPLLIGALLAAYALVSRVRFEFGNCYVVPEQLVFVPMVALLPLPYVPLLVAAAALLALVPDVAQGRWHRETLLGCLSDSWFCIGPVLVLEAFAPGDPTIALAWVYGVAFAAQVSTDAAWSILRGRLIDGLGAGVTLGLLAGSVRVDAILSPVAFLAALVAVEEPLALLAVPPLVGLLEIFSRDREARYAATLELQRAYRGTVTLLSDVVEFEDRYTADHSRSVVDLVDTVADELGVDPDSRQELEFAALLHDIGKIAIPKEILHKPAKLTAEEFAVMKRHTIEGQFMLDRVGGLLGRVGEVVRSCHERWDGQGYPDGLAGEKIPLAARIVFCCDAYNAMTTDRPYRRAMSPDEALLELAANAGSQFDPRMVRALTAVVERSEPVPGAVDQVRALLAGSASDRRVRAVT